MASVLDQLDQAVGPPVLEVPRQPARILGRRLEPGSPLPLITGFRWGALAVGGAQAAVDVHRPGIALLAWFVIMTIYAAVLTVRPLVNGTRRTDMAALLFDVAFSAVAVSATGAWRSPLVFCLLTGVIGAGFARGYRLALPVSVAAAAAVALTQLTAATSDIRVDAAQSGQWTMMLALVACVSSYARRISHESGDLSDESLLQVRRLGEANDLLLSLHRVAQTLPASLDAEGVLESVAASIAAAVSFDSLTILLYDDTTGMWLPARKDGNRNQSAMSHRQLPEPVRAAGGARTAYAVDLEREGQPGLAEHAISAIYCPLRARGRLIGIVAVESTSAHRLGADQARLLDPLLAAAGLALDNAKWFARLRTLSAEEERTRLARDLHDRLGQSLAFVSFELDRVGRAAGRGEDVTGSLAQLRDSVREVIGEVRETLYDLRTDVDAQRSLADVLREFLARVEQRGELAVSFDAHESSRMAENQERELLRIAQEAVTNVERHARARRLTVDWRCNGQRAELTVSDDGIGMNVDGPNRADAYGLVGMKERVRSIGARIEVESAPGAGTVVRVKIDR
ncbi:MAG: Signal transduction histidine kinase [Acidimicrobiia bacterium]|nr:Signal transduction histidine kinase [Acidimicrobiia bacterium]